MILSTKITAKGGLHVTCFAYHSPLHPCCTNGIACTSFKLIETWLSIGQFKTVTNTHHGHTRTLFKAYMGHIAVHWPMTLTTRPLHTYLF